MTALAVVGATAMFTAGCGGDSSGGDKPAKAADASDKGVEYSECMRSNGVPDFPDPENGRIMLRAGPGSGLDPNSASFKAAQKACKSKAPAGFGSTKPDGKAQARFLKSAKCMRANGVPDFPDPEISGGGVRMKLPQGVDPQSPQFRAAQEKCQSLHGEMGGAP